jgi:hypothetical protein
MNADGLNTVTIQAQRGTVEFFNKNFLFVISVCSVLKD